MRSGVRRPGNWSPMRAPQKLLTLAVIALFILVYGITIIDSISSSIWSALLGSFTSIEGLPVAPPPKQIVLPPQTLPPARNYGPRLPEKNETDDRVPIEHLSEEYGITDVGFLDKISAVGSVDTGVSYGTGSLVGRRDYVITAAHVFVRDGAWKDRPLSGMFFYSPTCNEKYPIEQVETGTKHPIKWKGLDFAFVRLARPACEAAAPFQVATLKEATLAHLTKAEHPMLSLGMYDVGDVPGAVNFADLVRKRKKTVGVYRRHVFGVFCRLETLKKNPGNSNRSDSALYQTYGCDTYPGGSGGPLLASFDRGRSYKLIGVLWGSDHLNRFSVFPRSNGPFAELLSRTYTAWRRG